MSEGAALTEERAAVGPGTAPNRSEGVLRIHFVDRPGQDDVVLMAFKDPVAKYAVLLPGSAATTSEVSANRVNEGLDIVLTASSAEEARAKPETAHSTENSTAPGAGRPTLVRYRGVELMWRPGNVTLQCDRTQEDALVAGLVQFAFYELELRRIEDEIACTWAELDEDRPLAFEATPADLQRSQTIRGRMDRLLRRRMRHARIEPHLFAPDEDLPAAGHKLGEALRETMRAEARLETVDGQLEVFEHVYEMASQRLGEFRASHNEHVLEWVIIVLLAAETLLMLVATLWKFGL
jgi:hypothetical protein